MGLNSDQRKKMSADVTAAIAFVAIAYKIGGVWGAFLAIAWLYLFGRAVYDILMTQKISDRMKELEGFVTVMDAFKKETTGQ